MYRIVEFSFLSASTTRSSYDCYYDLVYRKDYHEWKPNRESNCANKNNSSNQNHEHNRVNGHNNHNLRDSSHKVLKQPGPSEDQSKWPEQDVQRDCYIWRDDPSDWPVVPDN